MGNKILLIDGDRAFLDTSRAMLERNGYNVVVARTSEEGWQRALQQLPDLIVLEVMLESKTAGIGLVCRLKTCKQTAGVPILMVTGVCEELPWLYQPDDFWGLLAAYLEKPVKAEILLDWVRRTIRPDLFSCGERAVS